MSQFNLTAEQIKAEQSAFMMRVYAWMFAALVTTGFVSIWTASSPVVIDFIFGSQVVFWLLIIVQLICVASLAGAIHRMSSFTASLVFFGYSMINGLTLASIFLVFTSESIASTFFITAATFGAMSVYGYFTKTDLTSLGNILFMGVLGLMIASLVNMFIGSDTLYWITSYAGVLIFTLLTAYDTQKIKNMNIIGNEGTEEDRKESILGALTLYLDFINLFLFLLRIFGSRK